MIKNLENRKYINLFIEIFAIFMLTFLIEWFYFGFNNIDFKVPISYFGDAFTGLVDIKKLVSNNVDVWGWPYHNDSYKYSACYNMLYRLFVYICSIFTSNEIIIQNIYLFIIPFLNVFVSYLVYKYILKNRVLSYLLALLFGFCPYVQYRYVCHAALASIECVPIVFLIAIWLYEDKDFLNIKKGFWKNKKNILTVFLCWMIANNGMVYYPFFSCFILAVVSMCILIKSRKLKAIVPSLSVVLLIVFWLAMGFIPTGIGVLKGMGNVATNGATRNAYRATEYGLDLKSLLLSPKGYGNSKILGLYDYLLTPDKEQKLAYIGIAAIIGFLILLFIVFIRNNNRSIYWSRLVLLSNINLALVLLGVVDGFGVLVAILVPFISCYNRLSPFIVFGTLLAFGLISQLLVEKYRAKLKKQYIVIGLIAIVGIYSFIEQKGCYNYLVSMTTDANRIVYQQDKDFFERVDAAVEKDGMVFQLPYMKSFENGPVNNILDYDHYKGYIFADDIRWSYGATAGSDNDMWYLQTASMPVNEMVEELYQKGFSGIFLNLNGYEEEIGNTLKEQLVLVTNCNNVIYDESGKRVYISLQNYEEMPALYTVASSILQKAGVSVTKEWCIQFSEELEAFNEVAITKLYQMIDDGHLSNSEYIHSLYTLLLERDEADEENASWVEVLNNGTSRFDVMKIFLQCEEFKAHFNLQ